MSRLAAEQSPPGPIKNKFAADATANARILNRLLRFRVGLNGFANGSAEGVVRGLLEVRRNLLREFADLRASGVSRLEEGIVQRLGQAITAQLLRYRSFVTGSLRTQVEDIAQFVSQAMDANVGTTIASLRDIGLANLAVPSEQALRAISGEVVFGARIEQWWSKFTADQAFGLESGLQRILRSGGTVQDGAEFVQRTIGNSAADAEALARTMILGAANNANRKWLEANEDILAGEEWIATLDDRTCLICATLDGKVFPVGEAPDIPAHPNCFPAGVLVSGPRFLKGYSRRYEGDLVVLHRSRGEPLPVTPNHPILTRRGWVSAAALQNGDELIDGAAAERCSHSLARRADDQNVEAAIEDAARSRGLSALRVPLSGPDFHGDGTDGEVDIEVFDRLLADEPNAMREEKAREERLGLGWNVGAEPLARLGMLAPLAERMGAALDRSMRRFREIEASGAIELRHPHEHRFASVSRAIAKMKQETANRAAVYGEALGARLLAHAAGVEGSKLIKIDLVRQGNAHVFNLETRGGWYVANGVIVENCRCVLNPVVKGIEDLEAEANRSAQLSAGDRRFFSGEVPASVKFEDWLGAQPASVQRDVLGATRYDAWKGGKLELSDFVDSGRIRTIADLRAEFPRLFGA